MRAREDSTERNPASPRWRRFRPCLPAALATLAAASPGLAQELEPLPASSPLSGPVWTLVVPAALFLVALGATYLLYRHFADD